MSYYLKIHRFNDHSIRLEIICGGVFAIFPSKLNYWVDGYCKAYCSDNKETTMIHLLYAFEVEVTKEYSYSYICDCYITVRSN